MPGLAKKLLIFASVDGLFLQPTGQRSSSVDNGGVHVEYGTNKITTLNKKPDDSSDNGLETHGIVGLLDLVSSSYLVTITRREEVARIREKAIFRVQDVCLIPLKGKGEAERAIGEAQKLLKQNEKKGEAKVEETEGQEEEEDVGDDTSTIASVDADEQQGPDHKHGPEGEAAALEPPKGGVVKRSSTFVRNVVQDRGKFGRMAGRWFSRNGSKEQVRRQEGSGAEGGAEGEGKEELTREQERQVEEAMAEGNEGKDGGKKEEVDKKKDVEGNEDKKAESKVVKQQSAIEYLTPRILRSARLYFSSSGFYFSYDHDISGTLAQRSQINSSLPLWKLFDRLYFWNHHLVKPFMNAGQDSLILPLMQGFIGQRAFSIARTEGTDNDVVAEAAQDAQEVIKAQEEGSKPEETEKETIKHEFLLTLISRRSVNRAGLRYLRRGIDDEGAVANNVETEQILSSQSWSESDKAFSLLQVRGSIPVFFSQSPYSFKPMPVLFGSEATNQAAFKKHFQSVLNRYGNVQVACLVDKHGTEVAIGEAFEKHTKQVNEKGGIYGKQIGWEWFDFHAQCKGMKFENVQILMDTLQGQLNSFGWAVKQNDKNIRQQTGVLRTNCMDCLDRTNVVQSAIAGWALQQQLSELGLNIDLKADPKTQWFNTLWADNGDAISKQYAGTSALKGDFTRTRKRNWTGALSDFSLTLTRYYNNIFGDYFLQTNIDYWLGNAGPNVFEEFETDMMSQDYALDMKHIRQNAIDTCVKIVLEDGADELLAGWTLSSPHQSNTLRTLPFEECVLLLTGKALYFCRFDWDTEKVGSFEKVELLDINEIWRGTYITTALGQTHLDEKKNVGFAVRFKAEGEGMVRRNTRSLSVVDEGHDEKDQKDDEESEAAGKKDDDKNNKKPDEGVEETRILAFKALPPKSVASKHEDQDLSNLSESDTIQRITNAIYKATSDAFARDRGFQHIEVDKPAQVQEHDVISVAEAKKATGYMESIGYSLKRLVWS
ncbi:hypothetical protein M409DRAFT_24563 [Zasmidium cellare ATCC 36951]|uniref:SAC domain-containing protein n=1 Tax=Zasmidium cellare ATCC 36951 TaxID=1080233 RepID=A0A6A6CD90_ZASCE|nr:uncharacterized protein M409DRAFT_24563 [Zasmidium cellare ATCC 36951]KAF2165177.1 hypothetical protein M409DRAFT_24563 [Zasmidium cellare ATCC 36951]